MKIGQLKEILKDLDDDMDVLLLWKNATCYRLDKVAILNNTEHIQKEDASIKSAIILSRK